MNVRHTFLTAAVLGLAVAGGAQAAGMGGMHMSGDSKTMDMSKGSMKGMMMGMHVMPATVDKVDHKTGMVDVTSEGMKLQVHFPPASLKTVKDGDKIDLHLGFSPAQ